MSKFFNTVLNIHTNIHSIICRLKIDYSCQLYSTTSPGRLKKLKKNSIQRKSIIIFINAFETSPVEYLHEEAFDLPLELRSNELGLRLMYNLRSNTTYRVSLNTLDNREDQNNEENEGAIGPMGVHL